MGRPIVIRFERGEQFANTSSLALGVGWSWGTCRIPFREVEFERENFIADEYSNTEWMMEHFSGLPREQQNALLNPERHVMRRSVCGLSFGGMVSIEDARDFANELMGSAIGFADFSVSESNGAINGGLLIGAGRNRSSDLNINRLRGMDVFALQIGGTAILGVSFTALVFGHFGNSPITSFFDVFDSEASSRLARIRYLGRLITQAYAFGFVNDASAGLQLPGSEIKFLASYFDMDEVRKRVERPDWYKSAEAPGVIENRR